MKNRMVFLPLIIALAVMRHPATAEISIADADAVFEVGLDSFRITTRPISLTNIFLAQEDAAAFKKLQNTSIPTQGTSVKDIFIVNADAILRNVLTPMGNQPPRASFTHAPENPVTNQVITFDGSSSLDSDGVIISYSWDLGDGTTDEGQKIDHFYDTTGDYTVSLVVTDDKRVAGSLASTVVVSPDTSQLEPVPESGSIMYTPASPSQLDDIILSISGQFPTSNAKISAISHSVDDSIISLEIATEWTEDEQDTVVTSWTTEKNIGRFEAGIYQLVITINSIEFLTSSLKVREKSVGQGLISMDFNLADGDQGQRIAGSAIEDSVYTVQLTIRTGSSEINGWSVSIDYDSDQLEYVGDSFAPGDFIPGLVPLVDDIAAGTVSLGGTVLGSPVFGSGSGTLGTLAFEVLDGFTESVDLIITENSFRFTGGMRERYEAYSVATITRAPVEPPVVGDFDGSGKVDFLDFFEFADAFGGTNLKYDLDGSGKVDFDDFFTFADSFGKEVRAKLMELARQYIGLPAMPQLQSNYPNPFNTSTTIRYQIIESGLVQLDIFDLVGQRTRSLISGIQEPGSYEILWDGANEQGMKVSTGIYLAKLQVGTFNDVRKMLLVK